MEEESDGEAPDFPEDPTELELLDALDAMCERHQLLKETLRDQRDTRKRWNAKISECEQHLQFTRDTLQMHRGDLERAIKRPVDCEVDWLCEMSRKILLHTEEAISRFEHEVIRAKETCDFYENRMWSMRIDEDNLKWRTSEVKGEVGRLRRCLRKLGYECSLDSDSSEGA